MYNTNEKYKNSQIPSKRQRRGKRKEEVQVLTN